MALERSMIKRIVSLAFLAVLLLLTARTCETESAECVLQFRVDGEAGARLRELRVRLLEPTGPEVLGQFRKVYRTPPVGDAGRWPLTTAAGDYRLELEVVTDDGASEYTRAIVLEDGVDPVIQLSDYLRPQSP